MPLTRQRHDDVTCLMLHENLTHRVTVTPQTGQDEYAKPTYGTPVTNVKCFVGRNRRRILNAQGDETVPDYQVHFAGTVDMGVRYKLTNAVDMDGTVIFANAVVEFIDDSVDSKMGRLDWLALAKEC